MHHGQRIHRSIEAGAVGWGPEHGQERLAGGAAPGPEGPRSLGALLQSLHLGLQGAGLSPTFFYVLSCTAVVSS